jgi:hypothetical protein
MTTTTETAITGDYDMQVQMTFDASTEAFASDSTGEFAAIADRVAQLMYEFHDTGEAISADLFDSNNTKLGIIRVFALEASR